MTCSHGLEKDIVDAQQSLVQRKALACHTEIEAVVVALMEMSAGNRAEAKPACTEVWRRVQKLLTDPQTSAVVKNKDFAEKMELAVHNASSGTSCRCSKTAPTW